MQIERILQLYKELRHFLERNGDNSIYDTYHYLCDILEKMQDIEGEELEKEVVHLYKMLYGNKGGLTEYYIWNEDYIIREKMNAPLDSIRSELWQLLMEYV